MNNTTAQKGVKEIVDRFHHDVETLADVWRVDVLRPFCRKHKLTFVSGMGTYAFFGASDKNRHLQIGDEEDAIRYRMKSLIPILRTLEMQVSGPDDAFGFYVSDVKEEEL